MKGVKSLFSVTSEYQKNRKNQRKISLIFPGEINPDKNILGDFWRMRLRRNQLLEIEFFKELGNIEICLQDQQGNTAYELQTPTAPTLHIMIPTGDLYPGIYLIRIYNSIVMEVAYILIPESLPPVFDKTAV